MFTLSEPAFRWRSFLPCRKHPLFGKTEKRFSGFLCGNLCCMPRSLAGHQKHPEKERPVCPRFPPAFLSAVPQASAFRKKTNEAPRRFLCSNLYCMPHSLASRQKHLVKERPVCPRFPLAFPSTVPQASAFRKKTSEALRRFPPRRLRRRKHYDASSSLTDTMRDTPRSSIATP